MNLLIFAADELQGSLLELSGRRARHLRKVLRVELGDKVRVGMVNAGVGSGRVVSLDQGRVGLEVELAELPRPQFELELILALPRPIMLQRIIKQATVLGVRRFHLIRSRRVEKSFFQSPVLEPDRLHGLLLEGMEQGMDTWLPQVIIHPRFKPFAEDVLPTLEGQGIIAHPGGDHSLASLELPWKETMPRILLAVGPEGGWNDFEVELFTAQGFSSFTMGQRILHVDTAVVALLSQLQLLYELEGALEKR
ncbi:16S rRNA (uracil(1498)-N(3))-methyltransferase [Desulfogranum mediterraneum]|uniref:16S rRNA (uracil(1498)-N(3))-methyltransferase n=1 Tax=Desulfogranum mediterraneum TaxID=160661 RepID=UPI000421E01C|nr:16S rRNA (uracil(1498)-N(3))-methyltransferase [Desulfogranum mediterraneum]